MSRRVNICIAATISLAFIAFAVFVFNVSYLRLGEAFRDLGLSVAYYFCKLFGIESGISSTVCEYSGVLQFPALSPESVEEFADTIEKYFSLLFNLDNFSAYWDKVGDILFNIAKGLMLALPAVVLLAIVVVRLYKKDNTDHNKDTLPLRAFKWVAERTYQPLKHGYAAFKAFLSEHGWIWKCWVIIWVCNLNFATIGVEFFAYYFYFVISFDFANIYVQLCKLIIDLQVLFTHFPWWTVLAGIYMLFNRWRKRFALNKLRHFEARNCGFINELPIVSMACGSMGKKKNNPHHGHGAVARGHVPPKGALHIAAERYEIPILPVDKVRGRITSVYGTLHCV